MSASDRLPGETLNEWTARIEAAHAAPAHAGHVARMTVRFIHAAMRDGVVPYNEDNMVVAVAMNEASTAIGLPPAVLLVVVECDCGENHAPLRYFVMEERFKLSMVDAEFMVAEAYDLPITEVMP